MKNFGCLILDFGCFRGSAVGIAALAFLAVSSGVRAQDGKPKEVPSIEFSATMLGEIEVPPLYYVDMKPDSEGKMKPSYQPVSVSSGSRGSVIKLPFAETVGLYTGDFDEKGEPRMKPFVQIPAKKAGDRILLVFHYDAKGQPQRSFIDDSIAVHPSGSVRLANFSPTQVAFAVGGTPVRVAAGGEAITKPVLNEQGRFPFIYMAERAGQKPYESPTKLLRFRSPDQRLLILYTAMPSQESDGSMNADGTPKMVTIFQPMAYRLYDTVGTKSSVAPAPSASLSATAETP